MKIERKCHNCGKELWLRDDYKTYVCRRCGTEYVFSKDNKGVESMDQTKEAVADVLSAALCVNNEMLETTNAQDVRNYIREDFAKAMAKEIMKRLDIKETPIPDMNAVNFRAQLRIVRPDHEFE